MDASARLRKLESLDKLEKRVRELVNPSKVLLAQIAKERTALLEPAVEQKQEQKS